MGKARQQQCVIMKWATERTGVIAKKASDGRLDGTNRKASVRVRQGTGV
jgi:hypothetical protein